MLEVLYVRQVMKLLYLLGIVSCACVRLTDAQESGSNKTKDSSEDINLKGEQVCYFPDYELLVGDTQPAVYSAYNSSGLYIAVSSPSRCEGRAVRLEACAAQGNMTEGIDFYRHFTRLYRKIGDLEYEQIGSSRVMRYNTDTFTNRFACDTTSVVLANGWMVREGDVIGIIIESNCGRNNANEIFCLPYPAFRPSLTTPNHTLHYTASTSSSVAIASVTAMPGFLNVRAVVVPTPPPLPISCIQLPLTPTCSDRSPPEQSLVIGEVDVSPDPERRFWGGGIYIMPQKIPVNGSGVAVTINYTALLNTQGANISSFRFHAGLMRDLPNQYRLINLMRIDISSARPVTQNGFNNTIHPGSVRIPSNGWEVQEGDQFAVFVYNECTDTYCPAHVNLLNKEDCQSTLYLPFDDLPAPDEYTIDKTDPALIRVPVKVNMEVLIVPVDPSFTQTLLPPCSTQATPTANLTMTDEPVTTRARGTAPPDAIATVGAVFTILIIIVAALMIVIIFICVKWRRQTRAKPDSSFEEVSDIALSPTVHVEVSERGRIRRRSMDAQSQQGAHRTRAFSRVHDYSRVLIVQKADSGNHPAPPLPPSHPYEVVDQDPSTNIYSHTRAHVDNGVLTPTYETDNADYSSPVFMPADREEDLKTQLARLGIDEIPEDQLQFEEEIGRGQFGTVHKALWAFSISEDDVENGDVRDISAHVAVKVMDSDKSEEDRIRFLQETVIMGQLNDPNIVGVFGVVTRSTKLMMICELMDEDLRGHLTGLRTKIQSNDTMETVSSDLPALLLSYCRKIASSFVYLGVKRFIHRDLAARNILVSEEGDCKIADFGMSRDLQDDAYYKSHGGLIPVKWTAPEAIMYRKYSTKSDVWSYGILLYEIWSLGYKPYHDLPNQEVIVKVEKGYRLPPPPGCPRTIYDLMIKCTHPQPESRPTFTNILVSLQRPDYQLLKWTPEDIATSSESARMLGAPLEEGECLYRELQNTYVLNKVAQSNL